MSTKCPANEQVKYHYYYYLKHADGKSDATIRQIVMALGRYESFTRNADFRTFDQKRAVDFKAYMAKEKLAPATILSTIKSVKRFFSWLSLQPGYKTRIRQNDVDYLNLSENAIRAASAPKDVPYPSLAMIDAALRAMPSETVLQKRDRAIIAFGAITAIRVGALISLRCKHFDRSRMLVIQQPDQVNTKFGKRINTFLMPLSEDIETIFLDWVEYLQDELLFGPNDPLFPKTDMTHDQNRQFIARGVTREHWQSAQPVRIIYRDAFLAANLPPFNPHSFRNMIVSEMYRRELSIVECKAWSQNLGHEGALTTLTSYGKLSLEEQGCEVRKAKVTAPDQSTLTMERIAAVMRDKGLI